MRRKDHHGADARDGGTCDGQAVFRQYDDDGNLVEEMHSYGTLDIGIARHFTNGVRSSETYFAKRRTVSRRAYEKARQAYPDMPAPDGVLEDVGADLLRMVARERQRHAAERRSHTPDTDRARAADEFCRGLMSRGTCANAAEWVIVKGHTLGELTPAASRRIVERFLSLGCPRVFACEIDVEDGGVENTGHLVVELPQPMAERAKALHAVARIAARQGLRAGPDDGQRFAYVKLD